MNTAETILAAIDKLNREKARATDAPWRINARSPLSGTVGIGNSVGRQVAHYMADHDADLIVTLHRTIDAQVAILRDGLEVAESIASLGFGSTLGRNAAAFALARAVLGEAS